MEKDNNKYNKRLYSLNDKFFDDIDNILEYARNNYLDTSEINIYDYYEKKIENLF